MTAKAENSSCKKKKYYIPFQNTATIIILLLLFSVSRTVWADDFKPKVNGYIKPAFIYSHGDDNNMGELKVEKARIKISGVLTEYTGYGIQVDTVRDDMLLDAFIVHKIMPSISFRFGQFKTPYSTDNIISSSKIAFINRPYLKSYTSPHQRDLGAQVTYRAGNFDFITAVMNGAGMNETEFNNNKSMAYRIVARVFPFLQFSANFYTGKNDSTDFIRDEYIDIGASGNFKGFDYSGEYAQKRHDKLDGSAFFAFVAL